MKNSNIPEAYVYKFTSVSEEDEWSKSCPWCFIHEERVTDKGEMYGIRTKDICGGGHNLMTLLGIESRSSRPESVKRPCGYK